MIGKRGLRTAFTGVVAATLAMAVGSGVAAAQESPEPPKPVVIIGGSAIYPGEVVEAKEHELTPGAGPVGETWTADPPRPGMVVPLVEFGSSYARSTETFQFRYDGQAKAAGNLFSGRRIIRVSIQYNRRNNQGVDEVVGRRVNSNAACVGGRFRSGSEQRTGAFDSLGFSDPPTRFIYSTGRVASGQAC